MRKGIMLLIVIVLIVVPPFIWPKVYSSLIDSGKGLITLILSLLELFGLIVALAFVIYLFYQLIRYFFPLRFVFGGVSNESELLNTNQKLIYLSKLAWEELANQSQTLTNQSKQNNDNQISNPSLDSEAKGILDPLFFMPPGDIIDLSNLIVGPGADILDWVKSAEGKIPAQFGLIMSILSFLGAVIPPPVVKIDAYLQRIAGTPGKLGITFEAVDIKKKHNFIRTFWQDEKIDKSELTQWYIELLKPAMRWLVLECCKRRMISHIPLKNRLSIYGSSKKDHEARIHYLFGIQYYTSANQFKGQEKPFFQLAVDHLRQASTANLSWYLPDLYLANIYSFRMREISGSISSEMLQEALKLYETALARAQKANDGIDKQRVIISKALTELASGVETKSIKLIDKAIREIEGMLEEKDPADFDPKQTDCAAYLYNLATWYIIAFDETVPMTNVNSMDEARRYLAYSLARSPGLRETLEKDSNFESMRISGDLELLFDLVEKVQHENPKLAVLTGKDLKCKLDPIPQMIDQRLGRMAASLI